MRRSGRGGVAGDMQCESRPSGFRNRQADSQRQLRKGDRLEYINILDPDFNTPDLSETDYSEKVQTEG